MNADYAELFNVVAGHEGHSVRLYAWGEYRITWDLESKRGQLYRIEGNHSHWLVPPDNELSFGELARLAVTGD